MRDKTSEKRNTLRQKIIDLAQIQITNGGLSSLRARDLAAESGCALGSLYNMFADIDALILEVNARTLNLIDEKMDVAVADIPQASKQLKALAHSYLSFARANPLLWRALFEHHLPKGHDLPEWYSESLNHLMARITQPLDVLRADYTAEVLAKRARTLFAAVHGVVSISLDSRFVGLAPDSLASELDRFVDVLLIGSQH